VESWGGEQIKTDNGILYIILEPDNTFTVAAELLAISPDGKLLWGKGYLQDLPCALDSRNGLVYVKLGSNNVIVYGADGEVLAQNPENMPEGLFNESTVMNNVTYTYSQDVTNDSPPASLNSSQEEIESALQQAYGQQANGVPVPYIVNKSLGQFDPIDISAYDTNTGENLWTHTLPINVHTVTVTESNYKDLFMDYDVSNVERFNMLSPQQWYRLNNVTFGLEAVCYGGCDAIFLQRDNMVYVSYWIYNYEVPTFFNISKCAYSGGICAFNNNGSLVWSIDTDSRVTALQGNQANNSTIYYATSNGKIFATSINAVDGLALTAAIYLFFRFFLAGAVTRAKGRIDSNKNRNIILKYISNNPGGSLYDISKDLNMNKGTARYHLMILHINHRVVSFKADDKYVRYFTNAGSYTQEQQLVLSMMKRDCIKKLLSTLIEKPGLSNIELSRETGLHESAASRYMNELLEKGLVVRGDAPDGRFSYSIKTEYKEKVAMAIEHMGSG